MEKALVGRAFFGRLGWTFFEKAMPCKSEVQVKRVPVCRSPCPLIQASLTSPRWWDIDPAKMDQQFKFMRQYYQKLQKHIEISYK